MASLSEWRGYDYSRTLGEEEEVPWHLRDKDRRDRRGEYLPDPDPEPVAVSKPWDSGGAFTGALATREPEPKAAWREERVAIGRIMRRLFPVCAKWVLPSI